MYNNMYNNNMYNNWGIEWLELFLKVGCLRYSGFSVRSAD